MPRSSTCTAAPAVRTPEAYTLDGRRVRADRPAKGLYIVGDKKVMVK